MTLVILVFLGGVLSILSPCILPVIPFVFARGDQPFHRTGLPLLAGMSLTFAGVATLAALAGGWAVEANVYGRVVAFGVLAFFGLTLLSERLAGVVTRPAVRLGARIFDFGPSGSGSATLWTSFVIGIATGFLWAPCAGPILGLVLTAAALKGASVATSLLLLAYGTGAATSLAAVLLAGGRLVERAKRHFGFGAWVRRGVGVAVLAGVAAVATGLDVDVLSTLNFGDTSRVEQRLIDAFRPPNPASQASGPERRGALHGAAFKDASVIPAAFTSPSAAGTSTPFLRAATLDLPVERRMPGLGGATEWLNSAPLSAESLRGKVVLVEFWTYACINCRHVLPYVKAWAEKYREAGLVVVGVHTPELAFEKVTANVRHAVTQLGITYPVAIDTHSTIWQAFDNEFWPANYFVDAQGRIRYHHFGEEDYRHSEDVIRQLLSEAGASALPSGYVSLGGPADRWHRVTGRDLGTWDTARFWLEHDAEKSARVFGRHPALSCWIDHVHVFGWIPSKDIVI